MIVAVWVRGGRKGNLKDLWGRLVKMDDSNLLTNNITICEFLMGDFEMVQRLGNDSLINGGIRSDGKLLTEQDTLLLSLLTILLVSTSYTQIVSHTRGNCKLIRMNPLLYGQLQIYIESGRFTELWVMLKEMIFNQLVYLMDTVSIQQMVQMIEVSMVKLTMAPFITLHTNSITEVTGLNLSRIVEIANLLEYSISNDGFIATNTNTIITPS
jgi:hypothetical protein